MKDGQAIFNVRPGGVQIISLAASRSQPVTLAQATPAIEQFLLNERKRKLVADDLQALRAAAKIEYLGDFAADAARSPYKPPPAPELPPLVERAGDAAGLGGARRTAGRCDRECRQAGRGAADRHRRRPRCRAATLDKGLKGFK